MSGHLAKRFKCGAGLRHGESPSQPAPRGASRKLAPKPHSADTCCNNHTTVSHRRVTKNRMYYRLWLSKLHEWLRLSIFSGDCQRCETGINCQIESRSERGA